MTDRDEARYLRIEYELEERLIKRGLRSFRILPTAEALIPFPHRREAREDQP